MKSEHLSEEMEIAVHFLKEPEAEEIREILIEAAARPTAASLLTWFIVVCAGK